MYHNEDIFNYIERVKELRDAIVDGERLNGNPDEYTLAIIDNDVKDSFINGLPSELLVRVKLQEATFCYTLSDAITAAIQLSKTLEAESRRRKPVQIMKSTSPRVDYQTTTNYSPTIKTNNNSSTSSPPSQPFSRPFIKPLIPGQPGPNFPGKVCNYCKTPGHIVAECRKLAYKQNMLNFNKPSFNQQVQQQVAEPPTQNTSFSQNQGNAVSVPVKDGVHPNAILTRHQDQQKIVRFQEPIAGPSRGLPE